MSGDHLSQEERLALKAELELWRNRDGSSDYQLARLFRVSPGAVNKARLHAQVGRRVATAIYEAMGTSPDELIRRHRRPSTPGCMACNQLQLEQPQADGEILTLRLCQEHARVVVRSLYG